MILLRRVVARSKASQDDALDPVRGIDAHLRCDLLWCAGSDQAAIAAVQALGALANDDEVDVVASDHLLGQRSRYSGIQPVGPEVHVVVEREAQLEQQSALEQPARHVRRAGRGAYGAEQDHVGSGELGQHGVWEDLTSALPAVGSEVVRGRCKDAWARDGIEHLESFGDYLGANPIPADDGQVEGLPARSCLGHRRIVAVADGLQRRGLRQVAVA